MLIHGVEAIKKVMNNRLGGNLMKINFKFCSGEKGAITVIVAVGMVALLGFTALVVDVGTLYYQRRDLQNAADAAALAAAWELPGDVQTRANEYALKNNISYGVTAQKQNGDQEVRVTITNNYPRFFGRVFGSDNYVVSVAATAKKRWGMGGVMPFAPMPANYLDDAESDVNDNKVEPILYDGDGSEYGYTETEAQAIDQDAGSGRAEEVIYDYLVEKLINNVGTDYSGCKETRLEDFKIKVKKGTSVGVITGTDKTAGPNFGMLDLTGGQGAAGASVIAGWIYYPENFDENTIFEFADMNPGGVNSIFTGFNWEGEPPQSPIDYMLDQTDGIYHVILPHPSVAHTMPHSPIAYGDYLIAKIQSPTSNYGFGTGNNNNVDYRLVGEIIDVYNPLKFEDRQSLTGEGVIRFTPFLVD